LMKQLKGASFRLIHPSLCDCVRVHIMCNFICFCIRPRLQI